MAILEEGTINLVKGTPKTLFEATIAQLGILGGHIDLTSLLDADDLIDVQLQLKYTSSGAYFNAGNPSPSKQIDQTFYLTPLEASFGYLVTVTLTSDSVSATADLPYVIQKTDVST